MRLTDEDRRKIKEILVDCAKPFEIQSYLYGSRIDNQRAGGDIDLAIICSDSEAKNFLAPKKYHFIGQLYKAIGEQKIDLIIATSDEAKTEPFLRKILPQAIRL